MKDEDLDLSRTAMGSVLGPLLLGMLSDLTGNFSGGLYMLAGVSVALIVLSGWLAAETSA